MEETSVFDDIRAADTIEEAIACTIGAASTLWTEGTKGEFMSDDALELADALQDRFELLVRETIRATIAMTTAALEKGE